MENSAEEKITRNFAFEALREQRLSRRWGIFFKLLMFAYLLAFLAISLPHIKIGKLFGGGKQITALVDLQGVIDHDGPASAETIIDGLRAAFDDERSAAVIIRINSPGGSPVQAGYINDEIYRLKAKHPGKKVFAVIEDICASGGYYIAVAADQIYADKASIVGSIGVRMDSFGFVDAMQKLGVERRLLTAGEHKGFLDPFLPLDATEVAYVKTLLQQIHQQFINTVLKGRKDRIKQTPELFSGLVWTGEKAVEIGLIDGLGSTDYVAREIIKAEDIVDFTPQQDIVERVSKRFGAQMKASMNAWLGGHWQ